MDVECGSRSEARYAVETASDGGQRLVMERVINKLHLPPCSNMHVATKGKFIGQIIDLFWDKYENFDLRREYFDKAGRWLTEDCKMGCSHLWYYKYLQPGTMVLGFVARWVCSKVLGIGMAERACGALKITKDRRRVYLSGESTEM